MNEERLLRKVLRGAIPTGIRERLHPFPLLRGTLSYPRAWKEESAGPIWVLTDQPGRELVACGGALFRWSTGGADVRIGCVAERLDVDNLAAASRVAAELGVRSYERVRLESVGAELNLIGPQWVVLPSPFIKEEIPWRLASRLVEAGHGVERFLLHEGRGPVVPNVAVELTDAEVAIRDEALSKWGASFARGAAGYAEYRSFVTRFRQGQAEAYMEVTQRELRRLLDEFGTPQAG